MADREESGFPIASPRELVRAAGRLIRAHCGMFALTVAVGVVAAALALAPPWLAGIVIDSIESGSSVADVDRYGAALVGLAVLQFVISRYSFLLTARFGQRASQRLRRSMIDRVLDLPPRVVDNADTGDLLVRSTSDTDNVTGILSSAAPQMLISIVQVVLTFVFIAILSPLLALVTVIGVLGIVFATRWYLARATSAYLDEAAGHAGLAQSLIGTTTGARTVELYRLQRQRREDLEKRAASARRSQFATLRLRSVLFPSIDSSYVIALVLVLVVGAVLYLNNAIALGALIAILLYVRQISGPFDTVLLWLESLQSGIASFARVEGLASAGVRTESAASGAPSGSDITVTDVSYAYDHGPVVLQGIDLDIRQGEHLVIVGASGAGKSTLARLLVGIEKPTTGSVTLGGIEASSLPADVRRAHTALVTQEQHLFHDTIRTNLLLARPTATDEELFTAMESVGADWINDLPAGLDTTLGPDSDLAGAHAQQIALARVLLADPRTVVLDEATSLLTPGAASSIELSLWAVLRNRTVVSIAHRLSTTRDADRIAVMDAGRIRELGNHDELLDQDGLYTELWNSWNSTATTMGGPVGSADNIG
ncbi:ABC transporter ATP-binding protein [Planctomonas sp. JC2975]|uniref:ABC transporter ATP-binding protein n=1 Tax=Planctomonas sp. JC2975 TaxID=2729626 RepID=UPI0014762998|nr:ABC transporter ATP-binding protein [Planctomonas sp. JC2975]NNC12367.1 ABC transporter ATP-binding protein [Planctomonas sp. JC2975]